MFLIAAAHSHAHSCPRRPPPRPWLAVVSQAVLVSVVQGSLLGSILSNLLLVLGMCFTAGGYTLTAHHHPQHRPAPAAAPLYTSSSGLKVFVRVCVSLIRYYYKEQTFNATAAQANSTLLLVAVTALALPTVFTMVVDHGCELTALNTTTTFTEHASSAKTMLSCEQTGAELSLHISRWTSILLMFTYLQYLFFQLKTHSYLFEDGGSGGPEEEEEEEEECLLTKGGAITLLVAATLLGALLPLATFAPCRRLVHHCRHSPPSSLTVATLCTPPLPPRR